MADQLPEHEAPLSEQFRIIAERYVDASAAAQLLEELKSARMAQLIAEQRKLDPALAFNAAENNVKASPEWVEYITDMVNAKKGANKLKAQLEYIRMRHSERMSSEATERAERKL